MTSSREGMLSPAALWLFGRGNSLANGLIAFHSKFQLIQNNLLLPAAVVVDASNLMSFHPNSIAANAKQISCFLLLLVHTAIVKLAAYCSLTYIVKDLTVLICNDSQSNGTVVGGSGGGTRDLCITYKQNIWISMEGQGKNWSIIVHKYRVHFVDDGIARGDDGIVFCERKCGGEVQKGAINMWMINIQIISLRREKMS